MAQDALVQSERSAALTTKVLSLYSSETDTDAVIAEVYHRRCKFVDPLVSTRGHRQVKAQFRSLRFLLRTSKAELISSHYDTGTRTLTMDTTFAFKPRLWPFSSFRVRTFTVVVVDDDGLIRLHTDHWSVASLLEAKIGWLYRVGRRAFGAATSIVFCWLTKESKVPVIRAASGEGVPTAPSTTAGAASTSDSKLD